jgi:hypothetical protein
LSSGENKHRSLIDIAHSPRRLQITGVFAEAQGIAGASQAMCAWSSLRAVELQDTKQALEQIHTQLYQQSTGDAFLSAVQVCIDRALGEIELHGSGNAEVFAIRPHGWESLLRASRPLGDGTTELQLQQARSRLEPADWLLLIIGDRPRSIRLHQNALLDGPHLAEILLRHSHLPLEAAAEALWRVLQGQISLWHSPPSLAVVRRHGPLPNNPR